MAISNYILLNELRNYDRIKMIESDITIPHSVLADSPVDDWLYVPNNLSDVDWSKITRNHTLIECKGQLLVLSKYSRDEDFTPYERTEFDHPNQFGHRQLLKFQMTPSTTGKICGFDRKGNLKPSIGWFREDNKVVKVIPHPMFDF